MSTARTKTPDGVKERPIEFSPFSIHGLLSGAKTNSRRIMRKQPVMSPRNPPNFEDMEVGDLFICPDYLPTKDVRGNVFVEVESRGCYHNMGVKAFVEKLCPFGQPGDRLWVREAWKTGSNMDGLTAKGMAKKCADAGYKTPGAPIIYLADGTVRPWGDHDLIDFGPAGRYRHRRFMPRWASRITLELTDVRVERVQDISEEDAIAEGATFHDGRPIGHHGWRHDLTDVYKTARDSYLATWIRLHGLDSLRANPWVWVLKFRKVE